MSDEGSGFPPEKIMGETPEGASEGAWVPVIDPATELPPPPVEAQLPPPSDYPPPGGQYQAPPPGGQYPPPGYPAGSQPMSPNSAATIAYLTFIPAVVLLILDPYRRDSYVRFHAWQCLLMSGVWMVGRVLFHGFLGFLVACLLYLLLFIFWLFAIIKASKGERYHVPILGDLAEHLANTV